MLTPDTTAGLIILALVILANFIPSFIGHSRGVKHGGLLLLANFLFGWTVLGWFACLVYAVASDTPKRRLRAATPAYYDTHDLFPRRREPRL